MLPMLRILFLIVGLWTPHAALSHAQLRETVPEAQALLSTEPAEIILTFSEPASPARIRWFGPDGVIVEGEAEARNNQVFVAPPEGLGPGTRVLSWRVVSADGHPVGGSLAYSVGTRSETPTVTAEGRAGSIAVALRAAVFFALALSAGGAGFAALVLRAPLGGVPRVVQKGAAVVGGVLALLSIGVQGLDLLDLPLAVLLTWQPWQAGLQSPLGWSAVVVLLSSAAIVLPLRTRGGSALSSLAALGLGALSISIAGHALSADPAWVAQLLVFLHALALLFWIGSLVPLFYLVAQAKAAIILARFSVIAIGGVALLVITGTAMAWLQSGSLGALVASNYGVLLATKLGLFSVLLALAALNRLYLTPAVAARAPGAASSMRVSIRVEIGLAILILIAAASFRLTPPPRAFDPLEQGLMVHLHETTAMAMVTFDPGKVGANRVSAELTDMDGAPLSALETQISMSREDGAMEPVEADARNLEIGIWQVSSMHLPIAGEWTVSLDILINDFEKVTLTGTMTVDE